MKQNEAKEFLKNNLSSYLADKNINIRKNFRCLNPEHRDRTPSMTYNAKNNTVHCFGCGKTYDIFDLVGIDYGLPDFPSQFRKAAEIYGIAVAVPLTSPIRPKETKPAISPKSFETDYTVFFREAHSHIGETDYPFQRGLSAEIIERFNLGFVASWRHPKVSSKVPASPRLIIPTSKTSYLARDTRRDHTQFSKSKVGRVSLFNLAALERDEPCFVVEGEIDALSFETIGLPAVALGSTAMVGKFLDFVRNHPPAHALILALDNDQAGTAATDELAGGLMGLGIPFYRADIKKLYQSGKDANANLLKEKKKFQANAEIEQIKAEEQVIEEKENQKSEYREQSISCYRPRFLRGIGDISPIDTGFPRLNQALDDGLYPGLYVLGAVSSLGKTSFLLQMADQIAMNGQDVLIFSLEMGIDELIAKSISRLTYQMAWADPNIGTARAKTMHDIIIKRRYEYYDRAELKLISDAEDQYFGTNAVPGYGRFLYFVEGAGNIGTKEIRERVNQHIRITEKKPVVVIDYLQIIAAENERDTDKAKIDKAMTALKQMSRDFQISVLAISSLNRANYSESISMKAFKESGGIEYSSDALLGLQFQGIGDGEINIDEEKKKNPRKIELVILKNRGGATGTKIQYNYFAKYNFFEEK